MRALAWFGKHHAMQADWEGSGDQWNEPKSTILQPGQVMTVGWRLHLASSIRARDAALAAVGLSVVQGIPGTHPLWSQLQLCMCVEAHICSSRDWRQAAMPHAGTCGHK